MYAADRNALLCDLAETYGIFDFYALPVETLAALAQGLPQSSRIYRKLSGLPAPVETLLLAMAVDHLGLLVWMQTKDGRKKRNRPRSMLGLLLESGGHETDEQLAAFSSPEAFMAAREKAIGGQ